MPAIIIPRKWTQQPKYPVSADLSHWHNKNLVGWWVPINGQLQDIGASKLPTISGTSYTLSAGSADNAVKLNGTSNYINITIPTPVGTGDFTAEYLIEFQGFGTFNSLLDIGNSSDLYINGNGDLSWVSSSGLEDTNLEINNLYHIIATRISGVVYFYINNTFYTSITDTVNYSGTNLKVGVYGGTSEFLNAKIYSFRFNKSGVSATEALSRYREHWSGVQSKKQVLYFDVSTGLPTLSSIAASNLTSSGARLTVN